MVDRVDTTSTVWLGLTLGCARCHDHKFDPFKQKEFYQIYAYFNNVPERGKAFKYGNSPPVIEAPTQEQQAHLEALEAKVKQAENRLAALEPDIARAESAWERSLAGSPLPDWAPDRARAVDLALNGSLAGEIHPDPPRSEKYLYTMENGPATVQPPPPPVIEPSWKDGAASYGHGRSAQAALFDGKGFIDAGNVANFGFYDAFTLAAWIYPTAANGAIITPRARRGGRPGIRAVSEGWPPLREPGAPLAR